MLGIKEPNESTVSVVTALNTRLIEDEESGLTFQTGRETEIRPRDIRSNVIRKLLIDGKIKVSKGKIEFDYKGEHFIFDSNTTDEIKEEE